MNIFKASFIRDGREFTLCQHFGTGGSEIKSQPVNPKTGRGWQKGTILHQSYGSPLKAFAMFQKMKKGQ